MGTSGTGLIAGDLEVVGMNGAPLVQCGRALPVVRRKSDGMHCVLRFADADEPLAWHDQSEADQLADAGRWTPFDGALYLPKSCQPAQGGTVSSQPMIVYADEAMLDAADRLPRPPLLAGEYTIWRGLRGHRPEIQAACASEETAASLLNDWARALHRRFDAMHRLGRDETYLRHIADIALCAASERSLRWKLYLRYATAQEHDRVRRTFDTFISREFPNVSWEDFIEELKSLNDVLGAVPPRMPQGPIATSQPTTALPKIRDIVSASRSGRYQRNAA